MSIPEDIYTIALHGLRPLLPVLGRGRSKLARGIRGRRGAVERMQRWALEHRDPDRKLVWFHAASVGEGLQARVVAERLRERRPDLQLAYTYFSPSAESFARTVPVDFADYLPLDVPTQVGEALDALLPAVVAFNKNEVWPNLARAAQRRDLRLALLSATLPAGSSRLAGVARPLLARAFGRLDRLAAISAEDADRFAALGVPTERRCVMGDARFDQVWRRARDAEPTTSPLLRPLLEPQRPTLVAGSTWPPDEERLISAIASLRATGARLRTILVPHEPAREQLRQVEQRLDEQRLWRLRLSEVERHGEPMEWEVLVVDRVGVLGELYALADIAYVGGGFGLAGLHSVLEPAAFGVPVLFGPHHANAREAAELIAAGGAFAVAGTGELLERLRSLSGGAEPRSTAGAAAAAYVEAGLGAADRGADVIEELLDTARV